MTVSAPAERAALAARLRRDLAPLGRMGTTLSYRQAVEAMGLRPPLAIRRLAEALEATMAEDAAAERPFLAAVVVSPRRGGLPAPGFFETARALGRPSPLGGEAAFHAAERARLGRGG